LGKGRQMENEKNKGDADDMLHEIMCLFALKV
jgi:hypothetical protein